MTRHSYDGMVEYLDRYWACSDISSVSPNANAFLNQAYYIIKQLVEDVQELQQQVENITKPSVN